jgi:hypothetical protein
LRGAQRRSNLLHLKCTFSRRLTWVLLRSSALFTQVVIQVSPLRVHGVDEVELLFARSGLDFMFHFQSVPDPVKFLIPDKFVHIVLCRKRTPVLFAAVAVNAVFEGAGGAGVEDGVVFSGDDVCVTFLWAWR